jgi:O-antigen/teichoic acid export membrane protein
MFPKIKMIWKDMVVYGAGQMATGLIGLLLLPLYTRIFTVSEYGNIEMLLLIQYFLCILIGMETKSAMNYFFYSGSDSDPKFKPKLVASTLFWNILWGVLLVNLAILFSPLLNRWLFDGRMAGIIFIITIAGAFFSQIVNHLVDVFRLNYKALLYTGVSLGQTICSAVFGLILILFFGMGIKGYFGGFLIGGMVSVLICIVILRDYLTLSPVVLKMWPKLLRFGIPLVPASIAFYFLYSADRWFIKYYLGSEDLGLYAVGVRLASITHVGTLVFRRAFLPYSMDVLHNKDRGNTDSFFELIFRYYLGAACLYIIIITALSPFLVHLISPPEFFNAFIVVGILSLAPVFYGCSQFTSLGTWKAGKTHLYTVSVFAGFAVNLVFNIILIPALGILGAAIGTALGMSVLVAFSYYFSQNVWKIAFNTNIALSQLAVCVLTLTIFILSARDVIDYSLFYTAAAIGSCALIVLTIRPSELSEFTRRIGLMR